MKWKVPATIDIGTSYKYGSCLTDCLQPGSGGETVFYHSVVNEMKAHSAL